MRPASRRSLIWATISVCALARQKAARHEFQCRCATPPNLFQHLAVGHLRESAPAVFLQCGHAEHSDAPKTINYLARYVCLPIDLRRIKMFIQKFAEFGERIIQLSSLRGRNARIRHHPIGNEMSLEQSLGKTQRLRACKKQFLSLLNLFLSLRVEFVHQVAARTAATHCNRTRACVQSHANVQVDRVLYSLKPIDVITD